MTGPAQGVGVDVEFITDTADAVDGERSKSLGIITIMPPPGVILNVDSISCIWEKGGFGGSGGLDGGRSLYGRRLSYGIGVPVWRFGRVLGGRLLHSFCAKVGGQGQLTRLGGRRGGLVGIVIRGRNWQRAHLREQTDIDAAGVGVRRGRRLGRNLIIDWVELGVAGWVCA